MQRNVRFAAVVVGIVFALSAAQTAVRGDERGGPTTQYRDPFLSRYAPGGGVLWGHRHPFGAGFHAMGPGRFPGTEPLGDYPFHIIVKNGNITLLGVVDSESDKTVAGLRAREVPGSFSVENELVVEHSGRRSTKH